MDFSKLLKTTSDNVVNWWDHLTQPGQQAQPNTQNIQSMAHNLENFMGQGIAQTGQAIDNTKAELMGIVPSVVGPNIGLNTHNPISDWIAQTPNYINQGVQAVQQAIPGQGFLQNAARDTAGVVGGIASLLGVAAQFGQNPVQTGSNLAQGVIHNYASDFGFDSQGQWSPQNIGTNFYNRPVSTVLDALPAVGLLGKLGNLGKAGEAGEATVGAEALRPNDLKVTNLDNYLSPTQELIAAQPPKQVLNDLFSMEDQSKQNLSHLLNYDKDLQQMGYSNKQLNVISSPMAKDIIEQGVSPRDFDTWKKNYTPQQTDPTNISDVVAQSPIENKINVLDYFRTPEHVLQKIGLGKEAGQLRTAWDGYLTELPEEINRVTEWSKQVPDAEKTDLFRYLDGNTDVTLTPQTQQVAGEIRQYLNAWADRLKLPEDSRLTNYMTHIFEKGDVEAEFDPEIAKMIRGQVASSTYDPFLQKRLGKMGYVQDPWRALDAYVKRATRKANLDPVLQQISSKADDLEESQYNYLKNYVDRVQMRPTDIDNLIDNTLKQSPIGYKFGTRPVTYLTQKARQAVYRGALGLNIRSALTNLTQGVNTYAELGEKYTAIGYSKLVQNLPKLLADQPTELDEVGVLRDQFVQDRQLSSTAKGLQTLDKGLFYLFETAEKINRGAAYWGAKSKGVAQGMSEEQAIEYAKGIVRKTQFSFGNIDMPVALQSDIAKTLFQFQNYSVKQAEFLGGKLKARDYAGLVRYVAASFAMVYGVGQVWGMKPTDMIPSLRAGVPPTMQLPYGAYEAATQDKDKFGNPLTPQQRILNKDVVSGALNYIPAGAQLKKTGSDILEQMQGGSLTSAGNLKYPSSNDLRGLVLGPSYNPNAQNNYNQNQQPFSKAETEQFKTLLSGGTSAEAAYQQIRDQQTRDNTFRQSITPQQQQPQQQSLADQLMSAIGLGHPKPTADKTNSQTGDPLLDELHKHKTEDEASAKIRKIFESGLSPEQIDQVLQQNGIDRNQAREVMLKGLPVEGRARVLQSVLKQSGPMWLSVTQDMAKKDLLTTGVTAEWLKTGDITQNQKKQMDAEIAAAKNNPAKNYASGYGYIGRSTGSTGVHIPTISIPRPSINFGVSSMHVPTVHPTQVPQLKPISMSFGKQTNALSAVRQVQNNIPTGKPGPNNTGLSGAPTLKYLNALQNL